MESEGGREARELSELGAHINAAHAEFALRVAHGAESIEWSDAIVRSFPHYLAITCGTSIQHGKELLRVGQALAEMPAIRGSFQAGELSFDKVRLITRVATAEDEQLWAEMAHQLSCSQLARLVRQYKLIRDSEDPGIAGARMARRGLWTEYQEDGMLRLVALLPPEDGALVVATLDALTREKQPHDATGADPAEEPWAARQADSLMSIFEHAHGSDELLPSKTRPQVVIHVEEAVLKGQRSDGRCEIEDGVPIDAGTARRMCCDAELITIIERNGSPLDVGRARHSVPPRLRRAVMARDKHCRFPGCERPAKRCETHHIDWWEKGGGTDLQNLIMICKFHHVRHHEGLFEIVHQPDGTVDFLTPQGRPIVPSEPFSVDADTGGAAHLRGEHEAHHIEIEQRTAWATCADIRLDGSAAGLLWERCQQANGQPVERPAVYELPPPPSPPPVPTPSPPAAPTESAEASQEHRPCPAPPAADDLLIADMLGKSDVDQGQPTIEQCQEKVLHYLRQSGRAYPGELCRSLGLSISQILASLSWLEIQGHAQRGMGAYIATPVGEHGSGVCQRSASRTS